MFLQHQKRFIQWFLWEEGNEQLEEPDQRRDCNETTACARHEKARLLFVSVSLFILLVSFFYYFLTRDYIPLFLSIFVLFLGYRCFDAWLGSHEPNHRRHACEKHPSLSRLSLSSPNREERDDDPSCG